ncbi:hypothetical protein [Nostoc parmelioides]|uniref:Uncharacterized protein n=1 Tax=Nostoc parmelioides FACHB-3921 TaxID=2692909 RepID=A0ABR8BIX6_9NOSO|nr:hypothetical protein [Nostoc parmelioides]MBD2253499.1 hypothetical protein [Nostoc parmelioides FACHB-3921]
MDFLVKAGRGSQGRTEAGEEKNYENNLLSSPASSASPAYPNRIEGCGGVGKEILTPYLAITPQIPESHKYF